MIAGLRHPAYGFIRQFRELFPTHPAARSEADWAEACARALDFVWERYAQVDKQLSIGRDPFLPILPVLEAPRPLLVYGQIAGEIRTRMPRGRERSLARARHLRALVAFRYVTQIPLRAKNLAECLLRAPGEPMTPMPRLSHLERPELWKDPDTGIWYHRQPRSAFKNAESPVTDDVELPLEDEERFYADLAEYISLRPLLLAGRDDPGTLFVKDMSRQATKRPEMEPSEFGEFWRTILRSYGIHNPYTATGAIRGLRLHGPHAVRHITATDAIKRTGGVAEAAALLFITEAMVAEHYARFLPKDRFARARAVLKGSDPAAARPAQGKSRTRP